jgi:VWFA-related protein
VRRRALLPLLPAAGLLLLLLALPGPAAPQAAGEAPEELFLETLDVEVVNVEVRVTDRKGRPVTGLTEDDFALYEDGRRVEIGYFSEVREGRERVAAAEPEPAPEAAGELVVVPMRPDADLRHFVLFLDLDHLGPGGLHRVLPDLEGFVAEVLAPGDRVMVVVRQGNLRVALEFTDEAARVAETLNEIAETAPHGLQRVSERRQVLRTLSFALGEDGDSRSCTQEESYVAENAVREYAGWVGNQVEGTVSALTSLVRALVGLPGPKVVLYVGEGLEQRPGADLFQLLVEACPVRQQELQTNLMAFDLSRSFQRLTADANANRVTFYTLDAGGLRTDSSVEIEVGGLRLSTLGQRMRTANLQHSLYILADETGGRAIFNTNRFGEELEEISRDVETYYSLGFVPAHQGDGRVHRLRVKVLADHHDARYRAAYRDKPLPERIVESMLGTLLFGVESNPLGVQVEVGEAVAGEAGLHEVPVRIRVPLREVVATRGAGFSVGKLRLVLVARDPEGEWTPVKQQEALFKLPEGEDPAEAERVFEVAVDLPPGENVVAVGVRDEVGGETSYLRETFRVEGRRPLPGTD